MGFIKVLIVCINMNPRGAGINTSTQALVLGCVSSSAQAALALKGSTISGVPSVDRVGNIHPTIPTYLKMWMELSCYPLDGGGTVFFAVN